MHGYKSDNALAGHNGERRTVSTRAFAVAGAVLAAFLWTYWPTIVSLAKDLWRDDNYSVGQLVPFVALWLVWRDRRALSRSRMRPAWWGIGIILFAQGMRFWGLLSLYESFERYSIVLTIAGLVLLLAGWRVFRRVVWILAFLFLMVPLPGRVHNAITGPLQTQATNGAVFLLELSGVTLTQEGNVILLNHTTPITVAEACNGLRMLTAFVIVAATLAYIVHRPRWQKAVLVLSSVPVALVCNVVRLWATAELFLAVDSKTAEWFFHDFAGYAMMPLAVLILAGELWMLQRLTVPEAAPLTVSEPASRGRRPVATDGP